DLLYFLDNRDLPVIKEEEGTLDKNGKQEKNPLNALNPALDDVNPLIRMSIAAVADRKPDQEIGNLLRGRGRDGQPPKGPDGPPARSAAEMPAAGTAAPEPPDEGKSRASADVLATRGSRLKGDAHETAVGVKGVLVDFDARRYRQEARYNQGVAGIRDLQARL